MGEWLVKRNSFEGLRELVLVGHHVNDCDRFATGYGPIDRESTLLLHVENGTARE